MLGAVDTEYVYRIVDALLARNGSALLAEVDAMAARSIAFAPALEELASLFHRVAIAQTVPPAAAAMDDADRVAAFADRFTPESVQLAYQICVHGRADLALAPEEATGFSMTLLRLLAFEPAGRATNPDGQRSVAAGRAPAATAQRNAAPAPAVVAPIRSATGAERNAAPDLAAKSAPTVAETLPGASMPVDPAAWPGFVAALRLAPMAAQLAAQTELKSIEGNVVTLALPATYKHLADKAYADKLKAALDQATGSKWMLAFEVGSSVEASLASQKQREQAEAKAKTEATFKSEPFVQDVLARFDAKIRPDSIKPLN
jgi:DNA polymerase-3 subunit gamma/tau